MPFQPDYDIPDERAPYTFPATTGSVGCLMLHGFMGSPLSSRPMAQYLAQHGVTMYCPLLPGHGQLPNKLHKVSRQAWIAEAEEALATIRARCDEIFIMGHSMGNVLGAHLITTFGDIKGMIMLAPAYKLPDRRLWLMRLLRYVMPWFYPYKFKSMRPLVKERVHDFDPTIDFADPDVQAKLPEMTRIPTGALAEMVNMFYFGRKLWSELTLPTLVLQGGKDRAVPAGSTQVLFTQLPGNNNRLEVFPEADHELMRPFDPAHTTVWQMILHFIRERSSLGVVAKAETAV